jgi:HK97 family phage portal protein
MKLSNIFEMKKREKAMYSRILQYTGRSPRYSDVNYRAIAQEGYKRNWIIFRCVQEIMKAAVQLEWKVVKNTKDGEEEIINHPALQLIKKPNPLYGQSELIKRAVAYYFIGGEVPFHRVVTTKGVTELYNYRPDRVSFSSTGDVQKPYADIKYTSGNIVDIEPENFMLWKNFNPLDEWDGLGHGMSMLEPILKNGDLLNEMVNWNISLLQNGGNLSGAMVVQETLPDEVYERTKEELKTQHQGSKNVGKFLLLEGGATYVQTGTNPKDMDWEKGKNSSVLDICTGIGVDPIIIGINEHSSYNNKNEAEKGLYTKTVIPLMQELADQLTQFIELQEEEHLRIDYNNIPCLQEDIKEMAEVLAKAKDMTINEKRTKRGLEPVKGGDIIAPEGSFAVIDGKVYLPMNLIDIEEQNVDNGKTINNNKGKEDKSFMY